MSDHAARPRPWASVAAAAPVTKTKEMEMTMTLSAPPPAQGRTALWTGRVLSGLFVAFMIFDICIKLSGLPIVAETTAQLGWSPATAQPIAVMGADPSGLVPRTSILGAVLFTGLFGGTVATHLRIDHPLFNHVLFGVYLAIFAWGGLYLRDERLRAVFPVRRST
jgi:hypothetical protein